MEDWQGWRAYVVIPLYVVPCASSVPSNAPEQAVFCNHLISNIQKQRQEAQEICTVPLDGEGMWLGDCLCHLLDEQAEFKPDFDLNASVAKIVE